MTAILGPAAKAKFELVTSELSFLERTLTHSELLLAISEAEAKTKLKPGFPGLPASELESASFNELSPYPL